jgi:hypothetical protein
MRLVPAAFLVLAACGGGADEDTFPCDITVDGCRAARGRAASVCERRIMCEGVPRDEQQSCIESEVEATCATFDCDGPYDRFADLGDCLAGFDTLACSIDVIPCEL